jgi:heat shock protein 4
MRLEDAYINCMNIANNPQAMDTDAPDAEAPKVKKTRKQVKKGELPLSAGTASLDATNKIEAAERESAMAMEDKLVADTEDKKNELESYVYELREKIDGQYAEFSNDDEKAKVHEKCTQTAVSFQFYRSRYPNIF